jgi:hypothetical protein
MRRCRDKQLVLDLAQDRRNSHTAIAPEQLLQALADLLLEALGDQNKVIGEGQEARDAAEDHA